MGRGRGRGFTLLELMVVAAILVVAAGLVLPNLARTQERAQEEATRASLARLRDAIMGIPGEPGFHADLRRVPAALSDLFVVPPYLPSSEQSFDRNTRRGWRGPYLRSPNVFFPAAAEAAARNFTAAYGVAGAAGDPAIADGWGRPIVIQIPTAGSPEEKSRNTRLVSAGPDGVLQTQGVPYPDPSTRGDDLVAFLRRGDL